MPAKETTTVESLLGVLSIRPMSGYDIRQFMERSTSNFWSESFGQIYPALKRMLAEGLIEVDAPPGEGHPAKKVYRITEAGRLRLRAWLEVPARPHVHRIEVLLKVFFGRQAAPGVIAAQIRGCRDRYEQDLARYLDIEQMVPAVHAGSPDLPYFLISVRFGIAEARAILAWADESLHALEEQR
jgi:DNA-binding PadR family transcriptional regulator